MYAANSDERPKGVVVGHAGLRITENLSAERLFL